ncbi:MAG: hypothetical protein KFF72_16990 [Arthrospira sp. SH-MAG29]|nr:hypothetical protein [Arthrospira sp. SH-MAG29]MBS0018018.1 hypothetical protein [Arthrospira sp. SH-MAG29]
MIPRNRIVRQQKVIRLLSKLPGSDAPYPGMVRQQWNGASAETYPVIIKITGV